MKKLTLFIAMLMTANMLFAQIIHIPADYPTIQQGINAAGEGDTILVQPGTYVENILIEDKNITLASLMLTTGDSAYISQTIIDGNASGSVIEGWNIDSTTLICGFTITNGKSQMGGGVHLYKADASLEWLDVTMNVAEGWLSKAADGSDGIYSEGRLKHQKQRDDNPALGGGIYSEGALRLTNSRVRNNWCQLSSGEITGRGGGIHICNAQGYNNHKIIMQDVEISNNQARVGGGVGINGGFIMIISNVNITNNIASSWGYDGYGGGIAYYDGGSDLFSEWTNVSISNNSAPYGGGIAFVDGGYSVTMVYQNISIEYNSATLSGGGIYLCENSSFEIGVWNLFPGVVKNIFINNNSSNLDGGGIYCEGYLTIDGSANASSNIQINNNNCPGKGGGISFHNSETGFKNFKMNNITIQNNIAGSNGGGINTLKINSTFTNLLITGNSSGESGGGLYTEKGKGTILNSTLSGNTVLESGGALYWNQNQNDILKLTNCILWENSPEEISGVYNASKLEVNFCNIEGGWTGEGNINEDPLFSAYGENPYQLSPGSPCIDAGTPDTTGLNLPLMDLLGNHRIWDGDGDGIARIDMGAYEFDAPIYVGIPQSEIGNSTSEIRIFPNPFTTHTTIEFSLPKTSIVSIQIFNAMGAKVAELHNGQLPAGQQHFTWHAGDLPKGLYFCRVQAGKEVTTRKIIKY